MRGGSAGVAESIELGKVEWEEEGGGRRGGESKTNERGEWVPHKVPSNACVPSKIPSNTCPSTTDCSSPSRISLTARGDNALLRHVALAQRY